ncbi:MAG: hypothetical protein LQ337_006535 [Flavoplaca oasis]|nr:MAG: hypothetical protein LQ337_006535 [Flavoplaca oasis]
MGQTVSKLVRKVPVTEGRASEDSQEVPLYKPKSTWSDQVRNKLQQAFNARHKNAFPFEKLPPELQLEVVRFTMPPTGLRPGFRDNEPPIQYDPTDTDKLDRYELKGERVPVSLFRVSKAMSAMALSIFRKEVPLHIDVSMWAIWHFQEEPWVWDEGDLYPCQLQIRELPQFKHAQNYQINVILDDRWFAVVDEEWDYPEFQRYMKERLRLVCDALANNNAIQTLTVTIPCLCCLSKRGNDSTSVISVPSKMSSHSHGSVSPACPGVVDFLSPLTRIKVAKRVTYKAILLDGTDQFQADGSLIPCKQLECKDLAHSLGQSMGCLDGRELNHEEREWKRIKEVANYHPEVLEAETIQLLYELWEELNTLPDRRNINKWHDELINDLFAEDVALAEESIRRDYREWQKDQANERRQQSLRRHREGGLPAAIWSDELQRDYEDLSLRKRRTQEEENWLVIFKEVFESRRRACDPLVLE